MFSLELYNSANLEKVAMQAPFLNRETEYELIENVQSKQCQSSAASLVMSHLRFIVSIANQYDATTYAKSDLVHEGVIGLLKAINNFDISKQFRLASFAKSYIQSEVKEFIVCNFGSLKIATTKPLRKLFFNLAKVNKTKTSSDESDLAIELGVSPLEVREFKERLNSKHYLQVERDNDDEEGSYMEFGVEDDYSDMDNKRNKEIVSVLIKQLNERERFIMYNRFLTDNPLKRREIAEMYGIRQQRVSQIEANALTKMRNYISESGLSLAY